MKTDEEILQELKAASDGLLMMSESDYPFEVVRWDSHELSPAHLRKMSGETDDAPVISDSVENFFRAATTEREGQRLEDRQTVRKFQRLLQTIKDNLEDIKVYKIGEINMPVYIVGRSPSGNWLGLSTRVVET